MPFGLTNSSGTFIRLMNHVLRSFIEKFVIVCFDDILIYIKRLNEHINHLKQVIEILRKEKLYDSLKKCDFCMERIVFIGMLLVQKELR
jgi:hypothetical protein